MKLEKAVTVMPKYVNFQRQRAGKPTKMYVIRPEDFDHEGFVVCAVHIIGSFHEQSGKALNALVRYRNDPIPQRRVHLPPEMEVS